MLFLCVSWRLSVLMAIFFFRHKGTKTHQGLLNQSQFKITFPQLPFSISLNPF